MPNEAPSPVAAPSDDPPRARALRDYLVDRIVALGVRDARVLRAMRGIPRHLFAPEYDLGQAYGDYPLSIGHEATSAAFARGHHERGTGALGPRAGARDRNGLGLSDGGAVSPCRTRGHRRARPRARAASRVDVERARVTNVDIHTSDGWAGWPERAPYDRVVVTAAPEVLPPALLDQLADRGRLVVPVGSQDKDQRLERWRKAGEALYKQDLGAVPFVPMVHAPPDTAS